MGITLFSLRRLVFQARNAFGIDYFNLSHEIYYFFAWMIG